MNNKPVGRIAWMLDNGEGVTAITLIDDEFETRYTTSPYFVTRFIQLLHDALPTNTMSDEMLTHFWSLLPLESPPSNVTH